MSGRYDAFQNGEKVDGKGLGLQYKLRPEPLSLLMPFVLLVAWFMALSGGTDVAHGRGPEFTYTSFVELVESGHVESVEFNGEFVLGTVRSVPAPGRRPEWSKIGSDRRFWSRVPVERRKELWQSLGDTLVDIRFIK